MSVQIHQARQWSGSSHSTFFGGLRLNEGAADRSGLRLLIVPALSASALSIFYCFSIANI